MSDMKQTAQAGTIEEFVKELSGFVAEAEALLDTVRSNPGAAKAALEGFHLRMIAIRGTALQLGFPQIAEMARLAEEIGYRGATVAGTSGDSRIIIRKSLGSLWDALTSIRYMLEHTGQDLQEENDILMQSLQTVLARLGGPRQVASQDEIEALLNSRG